MIPWTTGSRRPPISQAKSILRSTRKAASASGSWHPTRRTSQSVSKTAARSRRVRTVPGSATRGHWTKASITTPLTSTGRKFPIPTASTISEPCAGAAALRSPQPTRTSTPLSRFLMVNCAKSCSFPRAPIRRVARLSTLRLVTTRTWRHAIPFYICSTVGAKTNMAGVRKATPT